MDKVILITGASSGIGEGIARELGAAGGKILLGARRQARIEAIATEIRDAGGTALAQVLDVTDRHSMAAFAQAAVDTWGRIDVLVNNAGVMPLSPLAAVKVDEWERMIDVNIKGVLWGIGAVLPIMEAQRSGQIINIGSIGALSVVPTAAVYCWYRHAPVPMLAPTAEAISSLRPPPARRSVIKEKIMEYSFRRDAGKSPEIGSRRVNCPMRSV